MARRAVRRAMLGATSPLLALACPIGCSLTTDLDPLRASTSTSTSTSSTTAASGASTTASSTGSGAGGAGGAGVAASGSSSTVSSSVSGTGGGAGAAGGSSCGNGTIDESEGCDDGATVSGDGCSASCGVECSANDPSLYFEPASKHCYRFVSVQLGWAAAESDCVTWGGHLASITSAAEESFLQMIVDARKTGAWIGLSDAATEGQFLWSSGEPLVFTNWGAGEPDDTNHSKNCVFALAASALHWNDYGCNVQTSYVCERWTGLPQ